MKSKLKRLLIAVLICILTFPPMSVSALVGGEQAVASDGPPKGNVDTGGYYIGFQAVWLSAIKVPANNATEAEEYVKSHVTTGVSTYGVVPSGVLFYGGGDNFTAPPGVSVSPGLKTVISSLFGDTTDVNYLKSPAYDSYWPELLKILHNNGGCDDATYEFYDQNHNADNKGYIVVITAKLGFMDLYQDETKHWVLSDSFCNTYGALIGSYYNKAYPDMNTCRNDLINAKNNKEIRLDPLDGAHEGKKESTDTVGMCFGIGYKRGDDGTKTYLSSDTAPVGRRLGCYFTNYIAAPEGNYYGRNYWIPGSSTPPPSPGEVVINYEVRGMHYGTPINLKNGDTTATPHFLVTFKAEQSVIDKIRAAGGTYKIQFTHGACSSDELKPDYKQAGTATFYNYGSDIGRATEYAAPPSETNTNPEYITVTADTLIKLLQDQERYFAYCYKFTATNASDISYYSRRIRVTITQVQGKFSINAVAGATGATKGNGHENTNSGDYSASYVKWMSIIPVNITPIPWEIHSTDNTNAYAEIVANEAGYMADSSNIADLKELSQDWNVNAGIPSTENVSIAAGGSTFLYDVSGYIQPANTSRQFNIDGGASYNNNGAGTFNSGSLGNSTPTVKRKITFNVKVENSWGDNNVCTLSCSGHTASGGNGAVADTSDGTAVTSSPCPYCGKTVTAQGTNAIPASGTPGTPEYKPETPAKSDHKTCGCSYTLTYYCDTDTATCAGASISKSTALYNNQRYGGTVTATCPGGATLTVSTGSGLLCEGYTSGKGCTPTHATNCVHRAEKNYTFSITEELDNYAYRTIINNRIYGLSDAYIKDVDTSVVSSNAIGWRVSNSNLYAFMWRNDGAYSSDKRGGRLWFTQFKNPDYNGGWTSTNTAYTNNPGLLGYWMGDATVNIVVQADSQAADVANPAALDNAPALSATRGKDLDHFSSSKTATDDTHKNHNGDKMTDAQCLNLALHCVNAWQYNNNELYTINVISDCLALGVSTATVSITSSDPSDTFQNITSDVYAVDDGIRLFDYGFSDNNENHLRGHSSKYGWGTLSSKYISGEFSTSDVSNNQSSQLTLGYTGKPDADPRIKYGIIINPEIVGSVRIRNLDDTMPALLTSSCVPEGNFTSAVNHNTVGGAKFTAGSLQTIDTRYPYGILVTNDYKNADNGNAEPCGRTVLDQITVGEDYYMSPNTAPSFDGYYNKHIYPFKMNNGFTYSRANYYDNNPLYRKSVTDNGNKAACNTFYSNGYSHKYNTALVISNIDLVDTAKNGLYKSPITVAVNYEKLIDLCGDNSGRIRIPVDRPKEKICIYRNGASGINDIIIQNPVSVEYCAIIGNGFGAFANGVIDETGEDWRVDSNYNYSTLNENEKPNYIVMGNTFRLWVSDYGDFKDDGGSWNIFEATNPDNRGVGSPEKACSDTDGTIIRFPEGLSKARGYSNNMRCTRWTGARKVVFTFPVSYISTAGKTVLVPAYTEINLADVRTTKADGNYGTSADQQRAEESMYLPKNEERNGYFLDAVKANNTVGDIKYGLNYEFTCLLSSQESMTGNVIMIADANNKPGLQNDGSVKGAEANKYYDTYPFQETNKERGSGISEHSAVKVYSVEVVGRIGNLAIEDTEDFRFSNLFKVANDSWLINNVIHSVNLKDSNKIISTVADILLQKTSNTTNGLKHNTMGVTNVNYYGNGHGKAGQYNMFPLMARYNPVTEFKTEQMRPGYSVFLDIETVGNYYGINNTYSVENVNGKEIVTTTPTQGPISAIDTSPDARTKKVTITPYYVLYDYENNTYHHISLYAGSTGAYERYWTNSADLCNPVASIYTDVNTASDRWNVGTVEKDFTNKVAGSKPTAFTGEDYIGTANQLILDQYNRTYIGSSVLNGMLYKDNGVIKLESNSRTSYLFGGTYDASKDVYPTRDDDGLAEKEFINQSQRWYFKLGLPSSTYITEDLTGGNESNQISIQNSHNRLKEQHPYSVILCYATITVDGDVWSLKYNYEQANGGITSFTLFESNDDIPADAKAAEVDYPSGLTINPVDDSSSGVTSWMAPLFIMDPWNTSADDWDTYGTH